MELTVEQYQALMSPIRSSRVAKRTVQGKQLSYVEAWEIKAHLIRIFGFGNFDAEVIDSHLVFQMDRKIGKEQKDGWEVAYQSTVQLTVRDIKGGQARYTETAVGSATGTVGLSDLHDNAVKAASSDALKRCAINLGSTYGLSLYQDSSLNEVVRKVLVRPEGIEDPAPDPETQRNINQSLGAKGEENA